MAGLALTSYAGLIVLAVVLAWSAAQRAGHGRTPRESSVALDTAVRSAQRRFIVAAGFTAVLLLAGFVAALAVPSALGLPLAVAPSAAGAAGLLLYTMTPPAASPVFEGEVRVAALEPRRAWSVASRPALACLTALLVAMSGLLIITGITSSPDDAGRRRAITLTGDASASTASPYPGWFYAAPILFVAVCLAVVAALALHRIATTPSLPGAGLERHDRAWRAASARIVVDLVAAALALQLGGVAVVAGSALHSAASNPDLQRIWQMAAGALIAIGIAALVVSVVCFALAALRAFGLPHAVASGVTAQCTTHETGKR